MKVQTEQATVYRGGGRRWFTKRAAASAEARAAMFRKYPCDCDDDEPEVGYSGNTCYLHAMNPWRYQTMVRRLARVYLRHMAFRSEKVSA